MQAISNIETFIETLKSIQNQINHVHCMIECELETLRTLENMKTPLPPGYDGISKMEIDFDMSHSDGEDTEYERPTKKRRLN